MKKTTKALLILALTALFAFLLCTCAPSDSTSDTPPDGSAAFPDNEDTILQCDGYTLTVRGTVLKKIKFTVPGAAVRVTVPEGITEIAPDAGRMLFCAVSLTLPTTLEKYEYLTPIDLVGMDWSFPRIVEIYDLSEKFDFDLENAQYSTRLSQNLKVIHHSPSEASVLTEKDGFMFYRTDAENVLVGFTEQRYHLTVPSYYEGAPVTLATYAFAESNIHKITLSEGITTVSEWCFYRSRATEINLPSTLQSIDKSAFYDCNNLCGIDLPEGLKRIESHAFYECTILTDLNLPESLEYFDATAISETKITSVYLPRSLSQFPIPEKDSYLTHVTEFTVHPENKHYSSANGVLFSKDGSKLIRYPASKTDPEYTVPDGVKEIAISAFYYTAFLTDVTLSEGVESIGINAFSISQSLKTVTLPKTLTSISEDSFEFCRQLTSITAHPENSVFSTVDGVLFNKELTELIIYPANKAATAYTVPDTVTTIRSHAFANVKPLRKLTLPDGLTTIEAYAFYDCGENTLMITFPDSLEYIGTDAFLGCDLVLTWEYTGDWTVTDDQNEVITLTKESFDNITNIKHKYLQNSKHHTLRKIKTPSEN